MGQLLSKKPSVTEVDKAILKLKTQKRKLADYQKKVEAVMVRETEAVRQAVKEGRKDKAILALKKKKVQEDALKKADAWILNVEQQLADIEIASRQAQVFESLKTGTKAIQQLQDEISLDDVDRMMDETEEAREFQKELNARLSEQLSAEDEEQVLAELEELEKQLGVEEGSEEVTTILELPSVPITTPSLPKEVEEVKEENLRAPSREKDREKPMAA